MNLIDIHSHLEHAKFKKDLDKVIGRAKKENILIITSGVNPSTNRLALKIAEKYPNIKVSFGLYPLDALEKEIQESEKLNSEEAFPRDLEPFDINHELDYLAKNKEKFIAIGEIGLDYNWPKFQTEEIKEQQKENFEKILKIAEELNKPVIIHSRKAESDALDILEKHKKLKVILHCFSARKSLIKKGIELGYYFSIPPIITRLQHFQTLASMVPLTQLLTETDSPYLSPVAGKRNEPANVRITIKEIAKIKNLSEEKVADNLWDNAKKIFGI